MLLLFCCFQRLKIRLKQSEFQILNVVVVVVFVVVVAAAAAADVAVVVVVVDVVVVVVVVDLQTFERTLHPTTDPRFICWKPLVYIREIIIFWAMTLCDSMEEPVSCILGCVLRLWQQVAPSALLSVTAVKFSDTSIPSTKPTQCYTSGLHNFGMNHRERPQILLYVLF